MIIEPKPEFRALSEAEVLAALNDPDPENRIAREVSRLIEGYTQNFQAHVERLGKMPESIIHLKPSCPIEAVAIDLMTRTIKDAVRGAKG